MILIVLQDLVHKLTMGVSGIGIVERVIVLGIPQTLDKAKWESVRKVMIFHFTSQSLPEKGVVFYTLFNVVFDILMLKNSFSTLKSQKCMLKRVY